MLQLLYYGAAAFCSWRPALSLLVVVVGYNYPRSHSDNGQPGSPLISDL